MKGLFPILIALAVLAALAVALPALLKGARKTGALPYRRKDYLLTAAERSFFGVLSNAVGSEFYIFPKVRLADLVFLPKGTANRQSHLNRVTAKHVDFVLCEPQKITPVLVIELDDASHDRQDRQSRDAFVDDALRAAGLPIIRVAARQSYSQSEISKLIQQQLNNRPV
jgi:very-short-patch-repair endonuclease